MRLVRTISLVAALMAAVWAIAPTPSSAQIDIPILDEPSPSPSPSPTSSPTSSSSPKPKPKQTSGTQPKKSSGGGEKTSSGSGGGSTSSVDPVVSKGLRAWQERKRTPARTTTRLLELISQAHEGPGDPAPADMRQAFGRFPVVGYVWYQDDYGAPRFKPYYSSHAGNDLFAVRGTPVIAVADGVIWKMGSFSKGGNAIWLMGDDGVRYYYGHLDRFAKGMRTGKRLEQGDLIAFVGNTGNAVGTYPHVHFEINPGGLGTVNPKPILDSWLDNAEAAILSTIGFDGLTIVAPSLGAARWDRLFDLFAEPFASQPRYWAAGFGGPGGLLASTDAAIRDLVALFDVEDLAGPPEGAGGEDITWFDPLAGLLADAPDGDEGIGF